MMDSLTIDKNGNGVEVTWFDDGTVSSAGLYANKRQQGRWKYYHKNGMMSASEIYQDGHLMSKQYYTEDGTEMQDTTTRDHSPEFPNGMKAWGKYLSDHIYFPSQYKFTKDAAVTVLVTFAVNEEGNVSEAYVTLPFHRDFDDIALKIIRSSPKWQPAVSHNRKVKYYLSQSVTFSQTSD